MKLWLLRPITGFSRSEDPWEPWYDKCFGFVIRAETEHIARVLANKNAKDENDNHNPWLNSKYSTCIELTVKGIPQIIIRDIHKA